MTTTVPRSHGAHRPSRAGLDARAFLEALGYQLRNGGRRRLAETDDLATVEHPNVAEVLDLAGQLNALAGVRAVLVEREPSGPCEWCQMADVLATVTVYGDPDPRWKSENPLEVETTCRGACVRKAVDQARIEQNPYSRKDIRVEIGVSPR